jgi:uncharacterized cupin superfamily protein
MDVKRKDELIHTNASDDPDYQYAPNSKVFHTNQLFIYSEKVLPGKRASAPHFHKAIDEVPYITTGELVAFEDGESENFVQETVFVLSPIQISVIT